MPNTRGTGVSGEGHARILAALDRIVTGTARYARPTRADLAREAGIGRATLNRALACAPDLREEIDGRLGDAAADGGHDGNPVLRAAHRERALAASRAETARLQAEVDLLAQQLQFVVLSWERARREQERRGGGPGSEVVEIGSRRRA